MAFRGQSIAGRNYAAACRSTCGHNHATPSPVRPRRVPEERERSSGRSPRRLATKKRRKQPAAVGDKSSLEIPRHMLDGTSSLLSGQGVHPPSLPRPSLTPFFVALESRGEIQIYAPTAPGVFFELMKNESARPAQSHSLPPLLSLSSFFSLSSGAPPSRRARLFALRERREGFLNPPCTSACTPAMAEFYCRSCRS